jgi:hypothetical protein
MPVAYKRIAATRPAVTTELELYAVPSNTEIIARLTIINQHTAAVNVSVAHTDAAGAATGEDWLLDTQSFVAGERQVLQITAGNPETIRVQASVADVVNFHLAGQVRT